MAKTQEGYLLIADITGYTLYLSQSELDHAQEILAALLEVLVDHTRPPLVISRLAGDAVISYALGDQFYQGQTFIEMIENTYVAFRKAIDLMALNNTCQCNACANVSNLDLKFFVHYATFAIQHIGDHDELVGSDVNLVHRLLKNQVFEKTGIKAYTLYTEAAIRRLGLEELRTILTGHTEAYEHLGEAQVWIQDMHPVWRQKRDSSQISIPPDQVALEVAAEINMPPEQVWDYLTHPEYRKTLLGVERQEVHNRSGGRLAPGSLYHCYHGDKLTIQTILEWQPFERVVTQDLIPIPIRDTSVLVESRLLPTETGTRLVQSFSKAKGPLPGRLMANLMLPTMEKKWQGDIEAFKRRIEGEQAARQSILSAAEQS